MLGSLKDKAMKTAGQLLGSAPAAGVLTNPAFQDLVRRVVDLKADMRESLDEHVASVARRFNLVTKRELQHFKRLVRELENQVASLEHELAQQRRRANRAEQALEKLRAEAPTASPAATTRRAAAKKTTTKRTTAKKATAKKATAKKATAKKATAKKATAKKATAKKATAKKATAKKATAKKATAE